MTSSLVGSEMCIRDSFFDVKNDFKLPPGVAPKPGFHFVKNDFQLTPGPVPEPDLSLIHI
eukprot:3491534-Prorocentrum_lima.AAC.1